MSKFHDEFFRNGSPEHDKLMIKCLSDKGVSRICHEIDTQSYIKDRFGTIKSIMVCKVGEKSVGAITSVNDAIQQSRYGPGITCGRFNNNQCAHGDKCDFRISNKTRLPVDVSVSSSIWLDVVSTSKETEVIMKSRDFIIGYADAVITLLYKGTVDLLLPDGKQWKNAREITRTVKILVEAKPKLSSIGEVIRQLKTYKSLIHASHDTDIYLVIATYTQLDQDALDYLANEKISVVTFDHEAT